MRVFAFSALAALALAGAASAAQLYRWVDEQGRVEWRDTPPPANAKNVEQRTMGGNTIQTSTLPYSVQQAVKNFPVTLWVFECGEPCTNARNHLARRGVPHTVRDAQKEYDVLKKVTGSRDVPVLVLGTRTIKGYLAQEWDAALDSAGYPRTPPPGMMAQPQASAAKPDVPKPQARQP
jgi:glutaredoxin